MKIFINVNVFISFKDEMGGFGEFHFKDIQGIMCLCEASYLSMCN